MTSSPDAALSAGQGDACGSALAVGVPGDGASGGGM